MKYCPYCGRKLQENMRSCSSCGHQLASAEAPKEFGGGFVSGASASKEQNAIEQLAQYVAQSLTSGKNKGGIAKELVKQGWSKETAVQFVDDIEQELKRRAEEYKSTPEGRQAMAGQYKRHMLYGSLWAVGGTAVTIATYEAASEGGFFIVAWGAIIFGIIDFFRGLFGWLKYKD
jgi:uncharacterized protein YoaH (UPF0181 family)